MAKNTRIKEFKGLPHEFGGLDYTDDAEVEGKLDKNGKPAVGERAYTPVGSDNEYIFSLDSLQHKDIQKLDKNLSKRPEGDRITAETWHKKMGELVQEDMKRQISEGKDPFNTGNQFQRKQGGVKYATGGARLDFNFTPTSDPSLANPGRYSTPTIDDGAVQPTGSNFNVGQAVNYGQAAASLGTDLARISTNDNLNTDTKVNQGIKTTAKTALSTATPWGGAVQGLESTALGFLNTEQAEINGLQKEVAKDNVSAGFQKAFEQAPMQAIDSFTEASNLTGKEKTAKVFEGIGDAIGFTTIPKMIRGFTGNDPDQKKLEALQKQAGYEATLAARGRFQGEADVPRSRYNDQTSMRNGGMRKQYSGKYGSVKYGDGEFDAADYAQFDDSYVVPPLTRANAYVNDPNDAEVPYSRSTNDHFIISQEDANAAIKTNIANQYSKKVPNTSTKNTMTPDQLKQLYQGILGFGANAAGSIAYLAGEGKKYDKVKYPTYNPERSTAEGSLRDARDSFSTEGLRQAGLLNPNAQAQMATSKSKAVADIRENIANFNIGNRNQAQQFNIGTNIRGQQDEAANKGQALSNYYAAIQGLGTAAAGTTRQANMIDSDKMIQAMYENVFGKNKVV